jgi:hypothetical protein
LGFTFQPRLLNQFIARSQWHAIESVSDSETSRNQSIEAVGIRDSLINSTGMVTTK